MLARPTSRRGGGEDRFCLAVKEIIPSCVSDYLGGVGLTYLDRLCSGKNTGRWLVWNGGITQLWANKNNPDPYKSKQNSRGAVNLQLCHFFAVVWSLSPRFIVGGPIWRKTLVPKLITVLVCRGWVRISYPSPRVNTPGLCISTGRGKLPGHNRCVWAKKKW